MSVRDKKRIEFLESEISKAMDAINLLVAKNDKQRESYFATEKLYFDQKAITELILEWTKNDISIWSKVGQHVGTPKFTSLHVAQDIKAMIERLSQ